MINSWRKLFTSASFADGRAVKPAKQAGHIRISTEAADDGYTWGPSLVPGVFTSGVQRSIAIAAGLVDPTPEERAERARWRVEYERREAERQARLNAAKDALYALPDPMTQRILDLHHPEHGKCEGCDMDGWEAEAPEWPCRTVVAVAEHYGIELPDA